MEPHRSPYSDEDASVSARGYSGSKGAGLSRVKRIEDKGAACPGCSASKIKGAAEVARADLFRSATIASRRARLTGLDYLCLTFHGLVLVVPCRSRLAVAQALCC